MQTLPLEEQALGACSPYSFPSPTPGEVLGLMGISLENWGHPFFGVALLNCVGGGGLHGEDRTSRGTPKAIRATSDRATVAA